MREIHFRLYPIEKLAVEDFREYARQNPHAEARGEYELRFPHGNSIFFLLPSLTVLNGSFVG